MSTAFFAEQAAEALFPTAPQTVALVAATSSAVIDLATTLGMPAGSSFFIWVTCGAAFTGRGGAADPGAALATDIAFEASKSTRLKVTPATNFARFFSTAGGTLAYTLASR